MANKALKSLTFPDLSDTYTIPTKTSDLANDSGFITSAPVTSVNGQTGAVTLTIPAAASSGTPAMDGTASRGSSDNFARADHVHPTDTSREPAVTEVTNTDTGALTPALDAGKIYHFTGAITSIAPTLTAAASGQVAHYHFDFLSGATAATLTLPNTVVMPSGFAVEANKRYEIDILNNYGAVMAWATS